MIKNPRTLQVADISPNAVKYSLLAVAFPLGLTIVLLPLLPIILPCCWLYYRRYYATLEVVLTSRELQVSRGVLVRREQSIPLEKVTDLALVQGPIMRHMNIKGLRVETAGQTSGSGALVQLIGIVDTDAFRDLALDQRDKVTDALPTEGDSSETSAAVLAEIRDVLVRIDQRLGERDGKSSKD